MAGSWPLRSGLAASLAVAALLIDAAALPARSTGGPTAQYPDSRLAISMPATSRAGSLVTVTFAGRNAAFTQGADIDYQLEAFVQQRSVLPRCPLSYSEEFNNFLNVGGNAIGRIAIGLNEGPSGPFRFRVRYRSGPARRIVVCAYTRLITDDAAHAQLRHTMRPSRSR
jgi:hypothetical protein